MASVLLCCRPTTLEGVLALKKQHPAAKMVVGNTEVGIEMKFKHAVYPVLIGATHVPELNEIRVSLHGVIPAAAGTKLLAGPGVGQRGNFVGMLAWQGSPVCRR